MKADFKVENLGSWRRTHYSMEIKPEMNGEEVILMGWVKEIRDLGGICFIVLKDREGTIQITIPKKKVDSNLLEKVSLLKRQYCIGVRGMVRSLETAPRGVEVIPKEIKILGIAAHPLPIDVEGKIPAEIDVRLDVRPLDLRREENQAIFRIQHVVVKTIRDTLSRMGFMEVFTPRIIIAAAEGGASLFPVKYFEKEAYLAQSPQLYKEELTLSFEKVFEIGTFFRAEKSHTRRHLSEFISVDIEQAFATAEDVMNILEILIKRVFETVKSECKKELKVLNRKIEIPKVPFERISYDEALDELTEKNIEIEWGEDIPTPALRVLGRIHKSFYFIVDWPTKCKPFYIKPKDDKPEVSESFDLMYSWVELASGGTRVHDKELLIKRLKEQGLNIESFKYHLKVFDFGLPPHAGWGLGLSRLMMVITGKTNIRDVVLFPRDRFRLTP